MAEARVSQSWDGPSQILAMLYNVNRPKGKRARTPEEFHPLRGKSGSTRVKLTRDNIGILKAFAGRILTE